MGKPDTGLTRRQLLFGLGSVWRERVWQEDAPEQEPQSSKTVDNDTRDSSSEVLEQARTAMRQGAPAGAAPLYREYLGDSPDDMAARTELGICLYALEHYIQARVEFERVLRFRKGDDRSTLYLGLSLLRKGKVDKALKAWAAYEGDDPPKPVLQEQITRLGQEPDSAGQVIAAVEERMDHTAAFRGAEDHAGAAPGLG